MKGFVISPVLFVSLILIVGILLVNFSEIDKRLAEGIGAESRLKKLQADAFESEVSASNLLLVYSAKSAHECPSCDKNVLESKIKEKMNNAGEVRIDDCKIADRFFVVNYEYDFSDSIFDASIKKRIVVLNKITCGQINTIAGSATIKCTDGTYTC